MDRVRIYRETSKESTRARTARLYGGPLPLDPRDQDVVRAKAAQARKETGR